MVFNQIKFFLIFGILTVLIDFAIYTQTRYLLLNNSLAKSLGFISGTIFSFFVNRNITFHKKEKIIAHILKFIFLYGGTLFINVAVNNILLECFKGCYYKDKIAFLIATSTSAIVNFLGMKYFVFINKS